MTSQALTPGGDSARPGQKHDQTQTSNSTTHRYDAEPFRALIESIQDYAIYLLDPDGYVATWTTGAQRNKGYTAAEIVGRHYRCFFTPEDIAAGIPEVQLEMARLDNRFETEGWRLRKDGSPFWAHISVTAIHWPDGNLRGFAKITKDLTERKIREESLRASEATLQQEKERLRVTLTSITDGVISTDVAGRILLMNPAAEKFTGWHLNEVLNQPIESVMALTDTNLGDEMENPIRQAIGRGNVYESSFALTLTDRNGVKREIKDSSAPTLDANGKISGAVLTFQDITGQRAVQREIEFQATHDPLTGLANRRVLETRLSELIKEGRSRALSHTLVFVDLDKFKQVNDTAGHAVGDILLKEISALLVHAIRQSDLAARVGGDEFALVLFGCDANYARTLLTTLLTTISSHRFTWQDQVFAISASIGFTSITRKSESGEALMRQADQACYRAKGDGRNRICAYEEGDDSQPGREQTPKSDAA